MSEWVNNKMEPDAAAMQGWHARQGIKPAPGPDPNEHFVKQIELEQEITIREGEARRGIAPPVADPRLLPTGATLANGKLVLHAADIEKNNFDRAKWATGEYEVVD